MIEEAIIYAFILCILTFTIIDGLYRVSMKKDIECMHRMLHDIVHMLFQGADEKEIGIALQNSHERPTDDAVEEWDRSWFLGSY